MCWKWHQMSTLVERSGADEVRPSLTPGSDEDRRPHSQTRNTGHTSTSRTARCGPACRVGWEGRGRKASPYPNQTGFSDAILFYLDSLGPVQNDTSET